MEDGLTWEGRHLAMVARTGALSTRGGRQGCPQNETAKGRHTPSGSFISCVTFRGRKSRPDYPEDPRTDLLSSERS